ncbi:MAG: A/G-specific adenine glycosylase [Rhodospirillales bacterium]
MTRQDPLPPETISLLAWYDRHARELPWRMRDGERPDPYRVWLSEIMLQQTTVATVEKRFERFLSRWPTVTDLASAELDDVLHEWQGLGYYARARNLHRCAVAVVENWGGRFPDTENALLELPGIGDYTSAAIASIAFSRPSAPVDGNIIRVISRLRAIEAKMPSNKRLVAEAVRPLVPRNRPGDFAQAMMDLGATICTPKNPACSDCPWIGCCKALQQNAVGRYPVKTGKRQRLKRFGTVLWLVDAMGRVAVRRRPEDGLLGGMIEFPSTAWRDTRWSGAEAVAEMAVEAEWAELEGCVGHTFTHFHLELDVLKGTARPGARLPDEWRLVLPGDFDKEALPTVMKKVVRFVQAAQES